MVELQPQTKGTGPSKVRDRACHEVPSLDMAESSCPHSDSGVAAELALGAKGTLAS